MDDHPEQIEDESLVKKLRGQANKVVLEAVSSAVLLTVLALVLPVRAKKPD